jgi:hypothetical protein
MARFDRIDQNLAATGPTHSQAWGIGGQIALTELGNVIVRAAYTHERTVDPVSGSLSRDKLFKADIRFMW